MNLSDLKTGMVVKTRNDNLYLIIRDIRFPEHIEEVGILVSKYGWNRLADLSIDLLCNYGYTMFDIMRIYQPKYPYAITQFLARECLEDFDLIWERQ